MEPAFNYIIDKVTAKIMKVLLENPRIPYNKSSLAKAAEVSRDALYRRWSAFMELGLVEKAEVGSGKGSYWRLNPDSEATEMVARLMYPEERD